MVREIARLTLKSGVEHALEEGATQVVPLFRNAKGCLVMELRRQIETPLGHRLVVQRETLENHTAHFRNSEDFQKWRPCGPLLRRSVGSRAYQPSGFWILGGGILTVLGIWVVDQVSSAGALFLVK